MGTEFFGQCQTFQIGGVVESRDNDFLRTRFERSDHTREALLAWSLNHHALAWPNATLQIGPLDAIGHGQGQGGVTRLQATGHRMKDGVDIELHVLAVATPQS